MARVLIVDDEVDFLVTYERVLRRQGHEVVTAASVAEARARLEAEPFSLVIVDLRLPDGDGLAIARAARGASDPPPAVVLATAFGSEQSRQEAGAAGVAAYLLKPFPLCQLSALVGDLLHPQRPPGARLS